MPAWKGSPRSTWKLRWSRWPWMLGCRPANWKAKQVSCQVRPRAAFLLHLPFYTHTHAHTHTHTHTQNMAALGSPASREGKGGSETYPGLVPRGVPPLVCSLSAVIHWAGLGAVSFRRRWNAEKAVCGLGLCWGIQGCHSGWAHSRCGPLLPQGDMGAAAEVPTRSLMCIYSVFWAGRGEEGGREGLSKTGCISGLFLLEHQNCFSRRIWSWTLSSALVCK